METLPEQYGRHRFKEECSNSARIGLADRIQELPYALGTVARRTDEGGHHECTPKVGRVTYSFPRLFFPDPAVASVFSGASNPSRIPARQYIEPLPSSTVHRSALGLLPLLAAGIPSVQNLLSLVLLLVLSLRELLPETIPERRKD